jgi:pimeloyl-ACP methyl ester carboxylesterase
MGTASDIAERTMGLVTETEPARLDRHGGHSIAYHAVPGKSPGVVFCSGFNSDMTGTKAAALAAWAEHSDHAFLRFDYFGHGRSSGDFVQGTIGCWRDDALTAIDQLTAGPLILVGSSMGGWIALSAALARPKRIAGLVLIAPAPDFTDGIAARLTPAQRASLDIQGYYEQPSQYAPEPTRISKALLEDGVHHRLLDKPLPFAGPVRILQGMADPDVPWSHALKVAECVQSPDLRITLFKQGDHRLSKDSEIAALIQTVEALCAAPHASDFEGLDDGG